MIDEKTARAVVAAFWRKGRKTYVPLTEAEVMRSAGNITASMVALARAGLVRAERVSAGDNIWHITDLGRAVHLRHICEGCA